MGLSLVRRVGTTVFVAGAVAGLTTGCSDSTSAHTSLNTARALLLQADAALSAVTVKNGIPAGFITGFADSGIYLESGPGIPVGVSAIRALLTAEYSGPGYSLAWQPYFADVSAHADVGYTYGVGTQVYPPSDPSAGTYPLLYLAFWRKIGGTWKLEAWLTSLDSPGSPAGTAPTGPFATPVTTSLPSFPSDGRAADRQSVLGTDAEFSDASVYSGQPLSFTNYADSLGIQMFADYVYGRQAISAAYAGTPLTTVLSWVPAHADVATSNDLAFSVGKYVFFSAIGNTTASFAYGKYMTVWKHEADGTWRYLNDGGAVSPTP